MLSAFLIYNAERCTFRLVIDNLSSIISEKSQHNWLQVIYPDFPLNLTEFFPGKHLIHFWANKMLDVRNFVVPNCVFNFDAEQLYFKLQITKFKNKEVTVNPTVPTPQTSEKRLAFWTLNPKH